MIINLTDMIIYEADYKFDLVNLKISEGIHLDNNNSCKITL